MFAQVGKIPLLPDEILHGVGNKGHIALLHVLQVHKLLQKGLFLPAQGAVALYHKANLLNGDGQGFHRVRLADPQSAEHREHQHKARHQPGQKPGQQPFFILPAQEYRPQKDNGQIRRSVYPQQAHGKGGQAHHRKRTHPLFVSEQGQRKHHHRAAEQHILPHGKAVHHMGGHHQIEQSQQRRGPFFPAALIQGIDPVGKAAGHDDHGKLAVQGHSAVGISHKAAAQAVKQADEPGMVVGVPVGKRLPAQNLFHLADVVYGQHTGVEGQIQHRAPAHRQQHPGAKKPDQIPFFLLPAGAGLSGQGNQLQQNCTEQHHAPKGQQHPGQEPGHRQGQQVGPGPQNPGHIAEAHTQGQDPGKHAYRISPLRLRIPEPADKPSGKGEQIGDVVSGTVLKPQAPVEHQPQFHRFSGTGRQFEVFTHCFPPFCSPPDRGKRRSTPP